MKMDDMLSDIYSRMQWLWTNVPLLIPTQTYAYQKTLQPYVNQILLSSHKITAGPTIPVPGTISMCEVFFLIVVLVVPIYSW